MQKIPVYSNKIIALSGGIASGKSYVRQIFNELGFYTISADHMVHILYQNPQIIEKVFEIAPKAVDGGIVDTKTLCDQILSNPSILDRLEAVLLPELTILRKKMLDNRDGRTVIYEIPLLHETKQEDKFDFIIDLVCQKEKRLERAKERGMNPKLFEILDKRQVSDDLRRENADFVINTSDFLEQVKSAILELVEANEPQHN